ncbi:MAG: hypothetical protein LH629_00150, partial [Ignavibacteria bacterium]|nr:hypothetical protein [Ignavibacteria bacterium]
MKKSIYILPFLFFATSIAIAQLPSDYPFKTLVDNENNLLVTGFDFNNDLFVEKYHIGGGLLWHKFYVNSGEDRGMDLVSDSLTVVSTGYIYNSTFNNNDIILINLNAETGNINWTKTFNSGRDEKAFGIVMDESKNIYVAGYT